MTERQKQMIQKLAALAGLICLFIAFAISNEFFFTLNNVMTIGLQTSTIAFIGIGVTIVILTGGIDLSIGSVIALAGVAAGMAVNAGMPVALGLVFGVLVGGLCGLANGLFVTLLRLPPFIATLGMMMIARGIALYITNAAPVSGMPESFSYLGNGALFRVMEMHPVTGMPVVKFPGIPYPVILMVFLAILFTFALTKLRVGRYLYAIGSNEEAARLSGINTQQVKIVAYTASGLLAGLAGVVLASRLVTAQPNGGVAYELDAIASAVVGGTSLMGGVGTVPGTLIGAFIMGVLRNGLNMNGVSFFVQQIIIGSVIIITVAFDQLRQQQSKKPKKQAQKKPYKETENMKKLAMVAMLGLSTAFMGIPQALAATGEIAVIVKTANSNFWQNVRGGAEDAEKQLGKYKVTFQGPEAETNVAEQVNMVDNAINRGVKGIVLAPSDPNALVPSVKKAWENGIPVILIDSSLNNADKYYQSFLATDNRTAGVLAAEQLVKAMNGKKGKVAMMSFTPGAGSAIERDGGFRTEIEKAGYEVVGPFYSQADMVTALNQTIDVLASNQDLVGIFGSNEPTAVGMGRALKQQGYAGKIAAVGFDGNADLQSFVKDGTIGGIVVQSSYAMGYKGVLSVDKLLSGTKLDKFIDTGVVFVTPDNIETKEAKAVLY